MSDIVVKLKKPITAHNEVISEVVLREPRAHDFFTLGDPYVIARNGDGSVFPVEDRGVIQDYMERCVVKPDPALIGTLGLADAMAVKEAVLGFFVSARSTLEMPATS
ncbi:MAG: phage tail assembly protein [Proteobacteria bacterium]|nr:phage tail assembly protein [Pseudomonadota bacterium]